jgi:transposase
LILALNITNENPLLQLFSRIDHLLESFHEDVSPKRGRPKLYSDIQMLKCFVYQAFHRIHSFRELEWRLQHDPIARALIGLTSVPDYSTLCIRAQELESTLYDEIYQVALMVLQPKTRICFWDSTSLRASRFDSEARKGKGTRLGWYIGYKLHAILSEDRIPLAWDLTTANVYDNQLPHLLENVVQLDIFMILADAAYDDKRLFQDANELGMHLVTEVNPRRAKSLESIKNPYRQQNIRYVKSGLGKRMLRKRSAVERFFSTLKVQYHLENPRLFGHKRYRRHVMWVLFAYLCDRLVDKSTGTSSAKAPWNR